MVLIKANRAVKHEIVTHFSEVKTDFYTFRPISIAVFFVSTQLGLKGWLTVFFHVSDCTEVKPVFIFYSH